MLALYAVTVLLTVLCALNLILTLGVIKRLREHTGLISKMNEAPPSIRAGEAVAEFLTATVDGEPVDHRFLDDETLVGFFSPTCAPCKAMLPKFVEFAHAMPGGRRRVLAVVAGDADEAGDLAAQLRPAATVVVEDPGGAIGEAFKVRGYPIVLMVAPDDGGRIVVKADQLDLDRPAVAI